MSEEFANLREALEYGRKREMEKARRREAIACVLSWIERILVIGGMVLAAACIAQLVCLFLAISIFRRAFA